MNAGGMKEAWDNARSMESFDGDGSNLEEVGRQKSRVSQEKEYILYRDSTGGFWYRVEFLTDSGKISEYEYIFGKKLNRRRK